MQRDLYRIEPLHAESLSPTDWLVREQTPELVRRLADQLGCKTGELIAGEGGELYMHGALLIHFLLSTIPESGLTLQQLDPPAGRQREHIEFALSRFFNDEISMVIAGPRPDDDEDEEQPF